MKAEGLLWESFFGRFGPAASFHWQAMRAIEYPVPLAHPSSLSSLAMAARRCSLCVFRRPAPRSHRCLVSLAHCVPTCAASLPRSPLRPRPVLGVSFAFDKLEEVVSRYAPLTASAHSYRSGEACRRFDRCRRTVRCSECCRRRRWLNCRALRMQQ